MANIDSAKRNATGHFAAGYNADVRVLDFIVDFSKDFTMANATDDIDLVALPGGAVVVALTVQQLTAGTGTGTVVARVGTTTMSATLASTATAGTVAASVPAAIPAVVPAGGAELNLLGATAIRTDGKLRVIAVVVEGDRAPREATTVKRDAI